VLSVAASVYIISCKITLPPENVFTLPRSLRRRKSVVICYVVSKLTTTALNVSRNDVADRAIGKCHSNLRLGCQKRSFSPSIASANNERLSCALAAVFTPGVELFTLTAAALAAFAALLAESRFAASA